MMLSIPTVEDRIVHRALRNCIEPVLEREAFADFVSGFRPRRSRITSVRQAAVHIAEGRNCIADIDVAAMSEGAQVQEVVEWVARWVSDGSVLRTLRQALEGMPTALAPGSGIAPLMLNLRLVPVDQALGRFRVVRFADNYCIFCHTASAARNAFARVERELENIRLRPSLSKSSVRLGVNPEDLFLIGG